MATDPQSHRKKAQRLLNADQDKIEKFSARLDALLSKELGKVERGLRGGRRTPAIIASAFAELRNTLAEQQLPKILGDVVSRYEARLDNVADDIAEMVRLSPSQVFTQFDADVIEALIDFDISQVTSTINSHVQQIEGLTLRQALLGERATPEQFNEAVSDTLRRRIETELNTGIAGFERTVTLTQSERLELELFAYEGGLIKTSRPFCIDRDGKVYTKEQVYSQAWQTEQGHGLPVPIYLGGWNCRHHLRALSANFAKEVYGYSG